MDDIGVVQASVHFEFVERAPGGGAHSHEDTVERIVYYDVAVNVRTNSLVVGSEVTERIDCIDHGLGGSGQRVDVDCQSTLIRIECNDGLIAKGPIVDQNDIHIVPGKIRKLEIVIVTGQYESCRTAQRRSNDSEGRHQAAAVVGRILRYVQHRCIRSLVIDGRQYGCGRGGQRIDSNRQDTCAKVNCNDGLVARPRIRQSNDSDVFKLQTWIVGRDRQIVVITGRSDRGHCDTAVGRSHSHHANQTGAVVVGIKFVCQRGRCRKPVAAECRFLKTVRIGRHCSVGAGND